MACARAPAGGGARCAIARVGIRAMLRIEARRAAEHSPWRQPWGNGARGKPRQGAEDAGAAIFRPVPRLYQPGGGPRAHAMGCSLPPCRAGTASVSTRYAWIYSISARFRSLPTSASRTLRPPGAQRESGNSAMLRIEARRAAGAFRLWGCATREWEFPRCSESKLVERQDRSAWWGCATREWEFRDAPNRSS